MPLSSTAQAGQLVAVRPSSSSARRTSASRRCHGVHVRQVSNAAPAAADRSVDVGRPGQRHRALHLARRREHVLVDAAATGRALLVTDVQVHLGHGAIDRHGAPPRAAPGKPAGLEVKLLDLTTRDRASVKAMTAARPLRPLGQGRRDHRRRRWHRRRLRRSAVRGGRVGRRRRRRRATPRSGPPPTWRPDGHTRRSAHRRRRPLARVGDGDGRRRSRRVRRHRHPRSTTRRS